MPCAFVSLPVHWFVSIAMLGKGNAVEVWSHNGMDSVVAWARATRGCCKGKRLEIDCSRVKYLGYPLMSEGWVVWRWRKRKRDKRDRIKLKKKPNRLAISREGAEMCSAIPFLPISIEHSLKHSARKLSGNRPLSLVHVWAFVSFLPFKLGKKE